MHARARERFEAALRADPALHRAKKELVLLRYAESGNLDEALGALDAVVRDQQFQDVSALVDLATLESKHGDDAAAKANLQRALAIDERCMPALDQLALLYLKEHHAEMAALVASQAIEKDGAYAPIHNTMGLVQTALGKTNLAVRFFQQAADLDPKFFEAQMNLGQTNLSFHGFAHAETAFRRAIALRPRDYDAHLGLALAVRGQAAIGDAARVAEVHHELDACKALDRARPDAYFNEAILAQELEAKSDVDADGALSRSIALMQAFKTRAAGKPEYAVALRRADERIDDANATRTFMKE